MPESTPQALEQQIADLQRQLDAARAEKGQDSEAPYERQEVHDVVGEQIREQIPSDTTPAVPTVPSAAVEGDPSYQDPALEPQVQALVNVAFTQGVPQAIGQAVKTGNAALVDALHDVLADELHQELIARQKLQPVA